MKLRYIVSGAIASALLALSCCIAPLLFVLFGVSMASFSFLEVLSPYRPLFVTFAVFFLAYGWGYYRRRRLCLRNRRWVLPGMAAATVFVVLLLSLPYWEFE